TLREALLDDFGDQAIQRTRIRKLEEQRAERGPGLPRQTGGPEGRPGQLEESGDPLHLATLGEEGKGRQREPQMIGVRLLEQDEERFFHALGVMTASQGLERAGGGGERGGTIVARFIETREPPSDARLGRSRAVGFDQGEETC